MKSCFEKVREVPVWRWESEWMVMVLLALCEMASDSSKMMDEMEDNIERRKQRLKERMERKKNSLEAKDVPALSAEKAKIEPEAEALVPDPSFSEEQKKYVEELMRLVVGVDEVNIAELRSITKYDGFEAQEDEIRWFWEVLEEMSPAQRTSFLQFATARSRLPVFSHQSPLTVGGGGDDDA